jgi:hypothetical protein
MELHGSVEGNLTAAIRSARRLRGHPVHADTLNHWTDLLHEARRELGTGSESTQGIEQLIADLESELADRTH